MSSLGLISGPQVQNLFLEKPFIHLLLEKKPKQINYSQFNIDHALGSVILLWKSCMPHFDFIPLLSNSNYF